MFIRAMVVVLGLVFANVALAGKPPRGFAQGEWVITEAFCDKVDLTITAIAMDNLHERKTGRELATQLVDVMLDNKVVDKMTWAAFNYIATTSNDIAAYLYSSNIRLKWLKAGGTMDQFPGMVGTAARTDCMDLRGTSIPYSYPINGVPL